MEKKVGRNDPCPCGSGKKYKKCCELLAGNKKINAQVLSSAQSTSRIASLFHKKNPPQEKPVEEHPDLIL